MRTETPGI